MRREPPSLEFLQKTVGLGVAHCLGLLDIGYAVGLLVELRLRNAEYQVAISVVGIDLDAVFGGFGSILRTVDAEVEAAPPRHDTPPLRERVGRR